MKLVRALAGKVAAAVVRRVTAVLTAPDVRDRRLLRALAPYASGDKVRAAARAAGLSRGVLYVRLARLERDGYLTSAPLSPGVRLYALRAAGFEAAGLPVPRP